MYCCDAENSLTICSLSVPANLDMPRLYRGLRKRRAATGFDSPDAGNESPQDPVETNVTTTDIHTEIEQLSEKRQDLWHRLSEGLDPSVATEIKEIDAHLEDLWESLRHEKARLRFGEREEIVRRARAEERLERAA